MSERDQELIMAARAGDVAALEALLAEVEPSIYRFGLRMCGSEDDARDVLQETLLTAFRKLGEFRGEAKLSTWLYQIARSHCVRLRRPGGSVRADASIEAGAADRVAAGAAGPDQRAHARQIGEALAAALGALPEAAREAVILRDVEGLSADEAAAVAGVDVGALKSRLHRGRLELRAHLGALLDPVEGAAALPCPELAQELAAYAGAEIDQPTCARIEAHLAGCARCAGACDTLKRTVSLCRALPGGEVPGPVRAAVRRALRAILAP